VEGYSDKVIELRGFVRVRKCEGEEAAVEAGYFFGR
jgi:hypothetical protein